MSKIRFICDNKIYKIDDEKLHVVLKFLGYKGGKVWRVERILNKKINLPSYKINNDILLSILEHYKLTAKYFLKNINKL